MTSPQKTESTCPRHGYKSHPPLFPSQHDNSHDPHPRHLALRKRQVLGMIERSEVCIRLIRSVKRLESKIAAAKHRRIPAPSKASRQSTYPHRRPTPSTRTTRVPWPLSLHAFYTRLDTPSTLLRRTQRMHHTLHSCCRRKLSTQHNVQKLFHKTHNEYSITI